MSKTQENKINDLDICMCNKGSAVTDVLCCVTKTDSLKMSGRDTVETRWMSLMEHKLILSCNFSVVITDYYYIIIEFNGK